ncbi:alpha/beta hydrolase [Rhizobium sp. Root1220]|uniref:RBBP9/YdeN family alpha/beta hydrolase n=1 Tax=Rhizobium sp. Root1220 TaxID=1736432 RepID=UPI0006FDBA73|nr:alpha/beta hydrolase [Rhizobium sp. Root1220]KQV81913.1 hypothetical protein ASC90_24370 [Rhizobium sp. Root1220]
MTRVLILPGLFGSAEGHWQRHWLNENPDSRLVKQFDWNRPVLNGWLAALETELDAAGEAYIVAHSLGCVLAAHLAQRASAGRVKGALLVAPCDLVPTQRLHPGHISFSTMPTAPLPFPAIVVGSLNDQYMTLDRLTLFSRLWKAEVRNIGQAGHINIASGYGRWAGGYALLETLKIKAAYLKKIQQKRRGEDALAWTAS